MVGSEATPEALQRGQTDMLILANEFYEGEQKEELVKLAVVELKGVGTTLFNVCKKTEWVMATKYQDYYKMFGLERNAT